MRHVRLEGPKQINTFEAEIPEVPQGWVLIKTIRCGICGSDIHAYMGETIFGKVFPFHIGHEVCGYIEKTTNPDSPFKKGELVVINPFFTCNSCEACYQDHSNNCANRTTIGLRGPSGFSEYIVVPETSTYKARQDMNPERLCLAEPIANVIYGMDKLHWTHSADVLINGSGAIGLIFLQLVLGEMPHSVTVCDLNEEKLAKAKQLGADRIINPLKEKDDKLYNIIIDCTGVAKCIEADVDKLAFGGQLLSFGVCAGDAVISVSPFKLYQKDATILHSFALNKSSMQKAISLLESNRFDSDCLIDSVHTVEELEESVNYMASGKTSGKIVIDTTR